ncbi:MAG: response regulator [Bacteroidetes bacterium]|nr:response regulator [Bacteroidota bacterium]
MAENAPARILVVDDEPDLELLIRQRFRHKIRSNEISFDFAGNGMEALDKLNAAGDDFDLVLTDINMPVMDGLTLLIKIKEQKKHSKAVVVSAYGDLENIRTAMNRGAFDFITKPIDFQDLETTIYKTIEEQRLIRQGMEAHERLGITIIAKERAELEKIKAEQSEKFKQQFLANMSHEIRTPMNSIIGMTNLLINSELQEQQKKYLHIIRKSSENLLVIINDILDLSKIEAGKMEFEKIDFLVSDAVETVFHTMHYKAEEKQLLLNFQVDEQLPVALKGDPVRLNQVLINLTGNAIKFTDSGSVSIAVKKHSTSGSQVVVDFSVTDTGIGIKEEKLNTIFESFSQASSDTTRKFGGTGLGLTISKQLVELQNGSMYVHSHYGKGTTFGFKIPYEIGSAEAIGKKMMNESDVSPDAIRGIKILLVEDNQFNQMVAVDTLQEMVKEIVIEIAENGKEALEMLRANRYDVILMDIQMPEMDGFEATQQIRGTFPFPENKIAIIAMTANVTKDEVDRCFEAGMDDYIAKPFIPQDLLNKLAMNTRKKSVN